MKSFKEMRREAWATATSRWSFRLVTVFFLYAILAGLVFGVLGNYFKSNDIQTWGDFVKSWQETQRAGLTLGVPSFHQAMTMTWASSFSQFVQFLLQGIFVFGLFSVALRAIRDQSDGWFAGSLAGFKNPVGMLWLNILMSVRILLWTLLFILPGIIACFRYALAWYVKAEHPDYSASKCLAESGRLMKGHKFDLFAFGLSYIGWILLAVGAMMAATLLSAAVPLVATVAMPLVLLFFVFVMVYIVFGQAVFYTEVKKLSEQNETTVDL